MAALSPNLLSASSNLLFCAEDASWDDDGDDAAVDDDEWAPSTASLVSVGDDTTVAATLLAAEPDHMPQSDYLARFHSRSLDATARHEAVNWILKVNEFYRFRPVTAYLSVNYLDRFLSSHSLPRQNGKGGSVGGGAVGEWPMQLLSVACVSVAAKMEETHVPLLLDLQILEPRFVFEPRTVRRMELLLMAALRWRMRAVTPFDFLHLLASARPASAGLFSCASDLILSTHRVVDFLRYRPSVIASAAVLCAADENADFSPIDIAELSSYLEEWANKGVVSGCRQLMEEYLTDTCPSLPRKSSMLTGDNRHPPVAPQSPVGVLDAAACGSCDSKSSAAAVIARPENAEAHHHPTKRRRLLDDYEHQRLHCTASIDNGKYNTTGLDGKTHDPL